MNRYPGNGRYNPCIVHSFVLMCHCLSVCLSLAISRNLNGNVFTTVDPNSMMVPINPYPGIYLDGACIEFHLMHIQKPMNLY